MFRLFLSVSLLYLTLGCQGATAPLEETIDGTGRRGAERCGCH